MIKTIPLLALALMTTLATSPAAESRIGYEPTDTPATYLKRQAGQKVEIRLKSGEKLAGKVESVGDKTFHLSSLAGQEFFDAVIVLDDVSAVIVRAAAAK